MRKINVANRQFFISPSHYPLFWDRVENNTWEPITYQILNRYVNPNKDYIDIGAWIGPTILYAAQIAKRSFAIEPDPVAYQKLLENVALNNFPITTNCCAISDTNETLKLGTHECFGDSMSSIMVQTGDLVDVTGITIEEFVKKNDIDCGFIKIDIEGGEVKILPSFASYLSKIKPILYVSFHDYWFCGTDTQPMLDTLKIYNYILDENMQQVDMNFVARNLRNAFLFMDK
ncbi:MAG: FkbM family methyltransferase [Proteobacteria bacterium]|jgi:FkbM family methyltransferase|nr:FkbM family methyltransferase [Pseudomonadota bacterium]